MIRIRKAVLVILVVTALWPVPQAPAQDGFGGRDSAARQAVAGLEAYAVYKMGRYDEAAVIWEDLAGQGNTTAMINLANMHAQGQGRPRSPEEAARWLRQAADLGDQRAIDELAAMGR